MRSIDAILKKLNFTQNERILVVDDNGTAIVDSYDNKNTTTITGIKPIVQMKDFKNILNGNVASRIEVINGIKPCFELIAVNCNNTKKGGSKWVEQFPHFG